jgi:hypothetical protein
MRANIATYHLRYLCRILVFLPHTVGLRLRRHARTCYILDIGNVQRAAEKFPASMARNRRRWVGARSWLWRRMRQSDWIMNSIAMIFGRVQTNTLGLVMSKCVSKLYIN